jgi:hypothetical protein
MSEIYNKVIRTYNVQVPDSRILPDGTRQRYFLCGTVELTIDVEALAEQMARKAFSSKARTSRMASGKIVAKAHSIEEKRS